jgi:hypothetical protein
MKQMTSLGRPCSKLANYGENAANEAWHHRARNPTTEIARCARTASGHATAALPSSVMNWRRFTRFSLGCRSRLMAVTPLPRWTRVLQLVRFFERVIELVQAGELNPDILCEAVVKELRVRGL